MRDFRHENFAQFYGATVDSPYICIVFAFLPRTLKVTVLFDNMIRQSMKNFLRKTFRTWNQGRETVFSQQYITIKIR